MNTVYLVKRQLWNDVEETNHHSDELIAVCSTMQKAMEYIDRPNFDIIITQFTVDGGPDSEILMENIESYRHSFDEGKTEQSIEWCKANNIPYTEIKVAEIIDCEHYGEPSTIVKMKESD